MEIKEIHNPRFRGRYLHKFVKASGPLSAPLSVNCVYLFTLDGWLDDSYGESAGRYSDSPRLNEARSGRTESQVRQEMLSYYRKNMQCSMICFCLSKSKCIFSKVK